MEDVRIPSSPFPRLLEGGYCVDVLAVVQQQETQLAQFGCIVGEQRAQFTGCLSRFLCLSNFKLDPEEYEQRVLVVRGQTVGELCGLQAFLGPA